MAAFSRASSRPCDVGTLPYYRPGETSGTLE